MHYVIYGLTNLSRTTQLLSIALMIHKYIPYSAYQIKTVNHCQPIQAPLKYSDNYFHADTASC